MSEPDPISTMTIDSAMRLSSISYYDADRLPPGARMWIEEHFERDETYQKWTNPAERAA